MDDRSLGLSAVLQTCASIVHVEGAVTGSTAAVTERVSLEMIITVGTGGSWLVAGGLVAGGPRAYPQGEQ